MIGTKELLRLVREQKLVEDLSERELNNPEGSGFDLRLGEIFRVTKGEAFLGITERMTPKTELIAKYGVDKEITLNPGDFVVATTLEKVNLPKGVVAIFRPRLTLLTSGVALLTAQAAPGFSGKLSIPIKHLGSNPFRIELGARFVHAMFLYTTDNISNYRGQWQGGRTSTHGNKETQV